MLLTYPLELILYIKKWYEGLVEQSKLRTYKTYKQSVNNELYVCMNMSRYHRSLLACLRSCTLTLMVETGRYHSIPYDEKICKLCNTNEVEDEAHLVFTCPYYATYWVNFLYQVTNIHP